VTTRTPTLAALRRTCDDNDREGLIRLLFVRDRGRVALMQTAQETADSADQFLVRYLADMIRDVAAPAVVVTISRADGRATNVDRQIFTMLTAQLAATSTALLDVVALGADSAWSARRGRPFSPSRRRPAAHTSASPAAAR
jgi:hypothetical protein